ncbi:DUF1120 domain-containing protein [Pseudomonas vancouverensis]|uniref:DUF1120 domain-containing protein n=1 Tax=Pseudomonas vancouverensis TaxID=95300 RepID=UPI003D062727
MNKRLSLVATVLLMTGTASAFAASNTDLTVTGTITPSACTPTLSNGGTIDYGKISAKDLNADRQTNLTTQQLQMNVNCDAATLMAIETKDNRLGSAFINDTYDFGLGLINGNEKLGAMSLSLVAQVADGAPARSITSEDGGSTWIFGIYIAKDNIISVADTSTAAPIPVQQFTADLRVSPRIAPTNGLTLTNEVSIDGSVTMTVRYL